MPILTLLTDFGHKDPYVGVMKGQILKHCPAAQIVDLTHEVAPQDVRGGSFQLEQSVDYFPDGTVHLAVVDPGVGTARKVIAVRTETARFVAPDNGLLTRALGLLGPPLEIVELPVPPSSSRTFHGRDVMAPAAAKLAAGASLADLGAPRTSLVELDFPKPQLEASRVEASVLSVDHFGNVTLDLSQLIGKDRFTAGSRWSFAGHPIAMRSTYGEAEAGEALLLWSSHGLLELACREARADGRWPLKPGQRVELLPLAGAATADG